MFHPNVLFACALAAQSFAAAAAAVDVETTKTFDMRRPRAEEYASGPLRLRQGRMEPGGRRAMAITSLSSGGFPPASSPADFASSSGSRQGEWRREAL